MSCKTDSSSEVISAVNAAELQIFQDQREGKLRSVKCVGIRFSPIVFVIYTAKEASASQIKKDMDRIHSVVSRFLAEVDIIEATYNFPDFR